MSEQSHAEQLAELHRRASEPEAQPSSRNGAADFWRAKYDALLVETRAGLGTIVKRMEG